MSTAVGVARGQHTDEQSLVSQVEYWERRLSREFPMALSTDSFSGAINEEAYLLTQQSFADEVLDIVSSELREVRGHFGANTSLRYEDFGIGEGILMPAMKTAVDLGYQVRAWDFAQTALKNAFTKLQPLFTQSPEIVETIPTHGALQQLFGPDETLHQAEGYALALFSRILQHNSHDLEHFLPNIPLQALPGARIVIVTVFEEDNRGIVYSDSKPITREYFSALLHHKLTDDCQLSVVRERQIALRPETYTAITLERN